MAYFLDSNVFIRHLTQEPAGQAEKAKKIFRAIESGDLEAQVSLLVLNEVLWIMESYYEIPRDKFVPQILQLLNLPGIKPVETSKKTILKTLVEFQDGTIDLTDLYLKNIANPDEDTILSFDKHFDRFAVARQEKV